MNSIDELAEQFRQFPGIGPRQSKRFVYFLLAKNRQYLEDLSALILEIKKDIRSCISCYRFFNGRASSPLCDICRDEDRDKTTLLIVEKDVDLENIERSGAYVGRYFVLGGVVPILEKNPERRVRSKELVAKVKMEGEKNSIKEIILAFSVNAEGENTERFIAEILKPIQDALSFKISTLGRGVSTGSEVEYADGETLKSALKNRS